MCRIGDEWDLKDIPNDTIYLMTQTMEAWLIADSKTLIEYYGKNFKQTVLPKHNNLDYVRKEDLLNALSAATSKTTKGQYQKIKHASELLKLISIERVKIRSKSCKLMFDGVSGLIRLA